MSDDVLPSPELIEESSLIRSRTPGKDMQAMWMQVLSVLTMMGDIAFAGTPLVLRRSPIFPDADHVELARRAAISLIDEALRGAKVEERKRDG